MATTFAYKGRDASGKTISGTLEGDNETQVAESLRRMGYLVNSITAEKGGLQMQIGGGSKRRKRVKSGELVVFTRQFATMINAGLPLARCLGVMSQQSPNPGMAATIEDVLHDVEGGLALSNAMAKHPKVFNTLYVSMVKAGETGGILDEVLTNVAENLEKNEEIKSKIKSAMAYPVLMFIMSIVLVIVMLVFIVPVFTGMFAQLGGELPLPTQILVNLSALISSTWWFGIPLTILAIYGIRKSLSIPAVRFKWDTVKLRIPIVGPVVKQQSVSRFARTLGTLSSAGVPILEALDVVENTVGNALISSEVAKIALGVKEGQTIAQPLGKIKVFPPMVVQMVAVGEESGAMDTMLIKVAEFYDKEVATTIEGLSSILEPVMLIGVGLVIGGILISLYLPMFKLASLIK
ncbi:MAG: type II secretion system F family protein [Actinomycetota bacterium]